jgi:uncharacterized protein YrrD
MATYRRLIGLPVIALADGTRLGTVRHLVVDSSRAQIVGLALEDGRWWRPSPVLMLGDVVGLGGEMITTGDHGALVDVCKAPDIERLFTSERPLVGQQVVRADGSVAGWVTDYSFDPRSGRLLSLEVSPSGEDESSAPQLVSYQQVQVLGPAAVVLGAAEKQEPRRRTDDVRPTPDARQLVAPDDARQAAAPDARQPAAPTATTTGGDLARLFQERQERFLLGKVAQRQVYGRDRDIIVETGQSVTPELLARVKEAGKLLELTASVSMRRDEPT